MSGIIIAVDGFSGTGKSSTAKMVADQLGYTYIDSGAMYRAVTLFFLKQEIDLEDPVAIDRALGACQIDFSNQNVLLNGTQVEDQIRSMEINENVSRISSLPAVRKKLVQLQRIISKHGGVVMDGRDIGTVVFPEADLKVFMTASMDIRVKRRKKQLAEKGIYEKEEIIEQNLARRDHLDSTRTDSPLVKADDAVEIDTSLLTLNQQTERIVALAKDLIHENRD